MSSVRPSQARLEPGAGEADRRRPPGTDQLVGRRQPAHHPRQLGDVGDGYEIRTYGNDSIATAPASRFPV